MVRSLFLVALRCFTLKSIFSVMLQNLLSQKWTLVVRSGYCLPTINSLRQRGVCLGVNEKGTGVGNGAYDCLGLQYAY